MKAQKAGGRLRRDHFDEDCDIQKLWLKALQAVALNKIKEIKQIQEEERKEK